MAIAFEIYNSLIDDYVRPILDFGGLYISKKTGQICSVGSETPIVFDDKIALVPASDGMYKRLQPTMKTYELFNPFVKDRHIIFLAYLMVARLNMEFGDDVEDDESVEGSDFWSDAKNVQASVDLEFFYDGDNGLFCYQIIRKKFKEFDEDLNKMVERKRVVVAEGQYTEKIYALFNLCANVLKEFGMRSHQQWAKDILNKFVNHAGKMERNINTFMTKFKELQGRSVDYTTFDEHEEDDRKTNYVDPTYVDETGICYFDPCEFPEIDILSHEEPVDILNPNAPSYGMDHSNDPLYDPEMAALFRR